uniref:Uncharacterized protein n=1 Tax=Solanum lycopersicum TaxID=4081 RepID=K4ATZ5_SOLLC
MVKPVLPHTSRVKARLHEHILHTSLDLQSLCCTFMEFKKLDLVSTFRWESGTILPKVLGDDFESLARERSLLNWLRQRYNISKHKTSYSIVD